MSADAAPGTILIDILEAGRPEHYWQYEIQPNAGLVRMVRETSFRDYTEEDIPHSYQQPAGAGGCEHKAASPNGQFVARCQSFADSRDEFQIVDLNTSTTIYGWKANEGGGIRGFAWSPNSHSVAVLNVTGHHRVMSPLDLLSALSGHPIPHDTVFVDVVDVQKSSMTEYVIRKNVISSFDRILNWSEQTRR